MAILHQMLQICDILQQFAESEAPAYLEPKTFFLARSGVLTLAYSGFPKSILRVQEALEEVDDLPPRTPGSLWPKTTIGALHDGTVLTRREIEEILKLSLQVQPEVQAAQRVPVRTIATVEYEKRSLEKVDYVMAAEFSGAAHAGEDVFDLQHQKRVARILSQFSASFLDLYQEEVQQSGHHASHYCEPSRGQTVILDVAESDLAFVGEFKESVDRILPGYYYWFDPKCYHVTVRNISRV